MAETIQSINNDAGGSGPSGNAASNMDDKTSLIEKKDEEGGKGLKLVRCCNCWLLVFLISLLFTGIVVLVVLVFKVGDAAPRVTTECGIIEGTYNMMTNVCSFKGIPYAMSPEGSGRWKPPTPIAQDTKRCNATKVFHATSYGNECPQMNMVAKTFSGHEDCLYLDIISPGVNPISLAPVMVFIHGGYLQVSNASTPGYMPTEEMTTKLNVVFVSIQYRLGVFGFMVVDALPGRRGNYGLLDQVEALGWIQRNIRGFGGDPNKVTIFGQSSGGTSVWALMTSPKAKGLFHKAWMLSGSPVYHHTTEEAQKLNAFFMKETNCTDEACLLGKTASDCVLAVASGWGFNDSMDLPIKNLLELPLLVVDGDFMPQSPYDMWLEGPTAGYSDVPLIVGTTAQEIDLFPLPGPELKASWDEVKLKHYVENHLGTFGSKIVNQSLFLYPYTYDAEYTFTTMGSDVRANCGNNLLARNASDALHSDVYRYIVTNNPSSPMEGKPFGMNFPANYAFHGLDFVAFFNLYDSYMDGPTSNEDLQFASNLRDNIMEFVHSGKPKDPAWQSYPNITALVDSTMDYIHGDYHQKECDFWMENDFFKYSWIN